MPRRIEHAQARMRLNMARGDCTSALLRLLK
jgi:hypothetical protein